MLISISFKSLQSPNNNNNNNRKEYKVRFGDLYRDLEEITDIFPACPRLPMPQYLLNKLPISKRYSKDYKRNEYWSLLGDY